MGGANMLEALLVVSLALNLTQLLLNYLGWGLLFKNRDELKKLAHLLREMEETSKPAKPANKKGA